jgi:hypothetical protein
MRFSVLIAALALVATACGEESADDGGSDGPLVEGELTVELFPEQPMVADVLLSLERSADVRVEIEADPGIVAEQALGAAAGEVRIRVRGLAPDATHAAVLVASSGATEERHPFEIQTHPPLAGFDPSFEVTGAGSSEYRLFDHSTTPTVSDCGIFAVDAAGTTRFYLPSPSDQSLTSPHFRPPAAVRLLDDGTLSYVQNARFKLIDELGKVLLDLDPASIGVAAFHHDALRLPSGNWLILAHEFGDFPDPGNPGQTVHVAGDLLVEVSPDGQKVWEWSSFAHLDVTRLLGPDNLAPLENPQTGTSGIDWTHGNGFAYSAADDSILLSLRHQDWLIKIDHGSGDVVWKLGKDGDFTLASGTWFFHPHSPEWQPDGSLLLYDNGAANPDLADTEERSRPVRYELDEAAMTATQVWDETNEKYMSLIAGDADLLESGRILVLDSSLPIDPTQPFNFQIYSRLREVDPASNEWLWTLRTEDNRFVYRTLAVKRLPGMAAAPE